MQQDRVVGNFPEISTCLIANGSICLVYYTVNIHRLIHTVNELKSIIRVSAIL